MKKIILILTLCCLPSLCFAELEVYLSTQNLPYAQDTWTSASYPDSGSSNILIKNYFHREEFPGEYNMTQDEIKDLITGLFPAQSEVEKQERYNSLIAFEKQNLSEYLAIAISPDTDTNISDKQSFGFVLTSFESTFQACGIDLNTRQIITRSLINDIHSGTFADIDSLEYSDIRFGDCSIPFPDVRRGSTPIADSFSSNKLIATSLGGNPLNFGLGEDSVNLFSLSDIIIDSSYSGVQENNLLDLQSTRVEEDTDFEKQVGKNKILYVHQNYRTNLYIDTLISGDSTSGYSVAGAGFGLSHPLFIQESDSEVKRTLSGWQEIQEGIYTKTLIQEDTFELVSGVYVPKQDVGVTTYYAVLYNYDNTAPVCPITLFSHENVGNENFIFPEYPWFQHAKYGYFVCSDEESGCVCDSSSVGCFTRDDRVLSIPQEIPHSGVFQYRFWNDVGLNQICTSPASAKVFYDTLSPDMYFTLPGIAEGDLIREYVSNEGVLYDGNDIPEKRMYNITNNLSFTADENLNIQLQIYDPYDSSNINEGVSGLESYNVSISEYESGDWNEKIQQDFTFSGFNPDGEILSQDAHTIDFQSIADIENIFTQVGSYQVLVNFQDAAGNQSRVIFYFDITPGDIDITKSTLETPIRNTLYANDTDFYLYSLTLRDRYSNLVAGRNITNIQQSCVSIASCLELRLDMTGTSPSGEQALEIFNVDSVSDSNGVVHFMVKSKSPGVFTESFAVTTSSPTSTVRFTGENNTFLSPIIATLETRVSTNWVSNQLVVNQPAQYRVRIQDIQSRGYSWNLSDFTAFIQARHPDTNFILSGPLITGVDGVYFSGTFQSTLADGEKHKTLLEIIDASRSGVIISYILGGKQVEYRLSASHIIPEILQLKNTQALEQPVKIIGNLQGVGNTHNLTERQNTTEVNSYLSRTMLRKNVGKNIRTRVSGSIVGGVKFIDKSMDTNKEYVLESNPDFETLVVLNGNIHIQNDFNPSGKVVGIISYIDGGYNKETGYERVGNIYIEPNVESIHALLYADGGLISTKSGSAISGDISVRTAELQNQLTIHGSVFTRNTLAGAVASAGNYMLPGGELTTDKSLAVQYDLYYLRRGDIGCVQDAYGFCDIPEYLIITYDPRVISSPPVFFEN